MTDEPKKQDKNDAELPLPKDAMGGRRSGERDTRSANEAAADLIRKKIDAAYASEPSAVHEAYDLSRAAGHRRSKHQDFIFQLTGSGKSLAEIQAAWHEYYQGLTDEEKHEVWQEFYKSHSEASEYDAAKKTVKKPIVLPAEPKRIVAASQRPIKPKTTAARIASDLRDKSRAKAERVKRTHARPASHLQSLLFGLGVGCIVLLVFMFSFFNERFIAPFIQPSRSITSTPIISADGVIGSEPEIIIPKINVEIPVVYGVDSIEERDIQNALEDGVVHYANTSVPGETGNVVVVGHSSNNIFNRGKYKFAFVLLNRLEPGDTFYMHKDGKRYTYQVYKKEVVAPTDVSVLEQSDKPATATLITCDPPGTDTNRLVVVAEQISPDPNSNLAKKEESKLASSSAIIPGNAPSLWSRFTAWFTGY